MSLHFPPPVVINQSVTCQHSRAGGGSNIERLSYCLTVLVVTSLITISDQRLRLVPLHSHTRPSPSPVMRKPAGNKLRQAPLASFESFLSLETDTEDMREMRELQWNFNNNNINTQQAQQTDIIERQSVEEPWLSSQFSQLTRKQQNCEIYRVSKTLYPIINIINPKDLFICIN